MPRPVVDSLAFWPLPGAQGRAGRVYRKSKRGARWARLDPGILHPCSVTFLCHALSLRVCLELQFEKKKIHVIILINQMTDERFAVISSYMILHIYSHPYPFLKVCRL